MTVIKHPINSAKEFDRFVRSTSKLESKIFQIWLLSSSTALGGYYYFIFQSTNFFQQIISGQLPENTPLWGGNIKYAYQVFISINLETQHPHYQIYLIALAFAALLLNITFWGWTALLIKCLAKASAYFFILLDRYQINSLRSEENFFMLLALTEENYLTYLLGFFVTCLFPFYAQFLFS